MHFHVRLVNTFIAGTVVTSKTRGKDKFRKRLQYAIDLAAKKPN